MLQTILNRSMWSLVWLAVIGIAVALNIDMAREQPILFALVAVCLFVTSVALVSTRGNYRKGNYGEAFAALLIGILCLGVTVVSEVSFWSSSIEGVAEQIAREQAKARGVDLVQEKRRELLRQQTSNKSPATIEAEMQAALTKVYKGQTLATLTADCGDTVSPFFRYCTDYLGLKSQFASANELKELEGKVLADSTEVVTSTIKRSFYKAAQIGAEWNGGNARNWVDGIVAWLVLTMTALHTLCLYVGSAPVRATEARTEPKPLTLPDVAEKVSPPAAKPLALSDAALDRIVKEIPAPSLALKELFPEDPDGPKGGGKKLELKPSADVASAKEVFAEADKNPQKTAAAAFFEDEGNVVDLLTPKQRRDLAHRSRQKKEVKRSEGNVADWLAACTSQTPDKRVKATSQDCRKSYMAWCSINRLQPVGHKQMSRIISVEIYRGNDGARGPRNGKGAVFPGLLVAMPIAEQLRKRA